MITLVLDSCGLQGVTFQMVPYEAMRRVSWQTRLEAYVLLYLPKTKQKQIKNDGSSEHTPNRVTPWQTRCATGTPQINLEN